MAKQGAAAVRVRYRGREYQVVLGPPCYVEQRNGALMGSGMPSIDLADPETGLPCIGLTVEIPEAPLKPGQVLVGGKAEGLRALQEAGVVRHTGEFYRSRKYDATFAVCELLVDALAPPAPGASLAGRAGRLEERGREPQPQKDRGQEPER